MVADATGQQRGQQRRQQRKLRRQHLQRERNSQGDICKERESGRRLACARRCWCAAVCVTFDKNITYKMAQLHSGNGNKLEEAKAAALLGKTLFLGAQFLVKKNISPCQYISCFHESIPFPNLEIVYDGKMNFDIPICTLSGP